MILTITFRKSTGSLANEMDVMAVGDWSSVSASCLLLSFRLDRPARWISGAIAAQTVNEAIRRRRLHFDQPETSLPVNDAGYSVHCL